MSESQVNPHAEKFDPTDSFATDLPWLAEDAANLRVFMNSTTGRRLLGHIIFRAPAPTERSDAFKRGVQSGVHEGYVEAVHLIRHFMDSTKSVSQKTQK